MADNIRDKRIFFYLSLLFSVLSYFIVDVVRDVGEDWYRETDGKGDDGFRCEMIF